MDMQMRVKHLFILINIPRFPVVYFIEIVFLLIVIYIMCPVNKPRLLPVGT